MGIVCSGCVPSQLRAACSERRSHLQVDDGNVFPVGPPHDGVQVLQLGGQEGPEGSLQADGAGLLEAQVVGASDPPHVTRLGGVEGDEVELDRKQKRTQQEVGTLGKMKTTVRGH